MPACPRALPAAHLVVVLQHACLPACLSPCLPACPHACLPAPCGSPPACLFLPPCFACLPPCPACPHLVVVLQHDGCDGPSGEGHEDGAMVAAHLERGKGRGWGEQAGLRLMTKGHGRHTHIGEGGLWLITRVHSRHTQAGWAARVMTKGQAGQPGS